MSAADPQARPSQLPLLAVRDVVVFPHMILPLSVGRAKSIKALEAAIKSPERLLAVVAQKDVQLEDPQAADLFSVGVLCEVSQFLKMPDGTLKVFLRGLARLQVKKLEFSPESGHWQAQLDYPGETVPEPAMIRALMRHLMEVFEEHAKAGRRVSGEASPALSRIEDPSQLADSVAAQALVKTAERQAVLEIFDVCARMEKIVELLQADLEIIALERKLHSRVRGQIEKTQKEYYLTEQMKAIQKELKQKDDLGQEMDELRKAIEAARMPKAALEASVKELSRLEKMMPYSPESTVCRAYLDWMIHLPWSKATRDNLDVDRARGILEADHYDLQKVKERILEHLAVLRLTKGLKSPLLCFVGPPGVGKTSVGKSIAAAMGRKFVRLSLGGVRDESEIRGHRRTYIGSLPGRIIQSLRKAGSRNPLFLLDEIDKIGMDWRGDPAAALLEVLDPEQNSTFLDHYLDVEFDLSQVMFICTANTLETIPAALQDRLEVLRFPGYTHNEKRQIARTYLLPKQLKEHGFKEGLVAVSDAAIDRAIDEYTREAGVRGLNREIASLARKAAMKMVSGEAKTLAVEADNLPQFLGIPKFVKEKNSYNAVGVSTGLAWTEAGGVTMAVEVAAFPGKGELRLTGKLGSVMSESAQAAFSYLKSMAKELHVAPELFKDLDYHIHVPEGATPKDGPSAGIAMASALASLMTGRPVMPGIAMTGEITLRGRVLPIGGLKEKILAAHREAIKTVLYPEQNTKDLEEVPAEIKADLNLVAVKNFQEVISLALTPGLPAAGAKDFSPRATAAWTPGASTPPRPSQGLS